MFDGNVTGISYRFSDVTTYLIGVNRLHLMQINPRKNDKELKSELSFFQSDYLSDRNEPAAFVAD